MRLACCAVHEVSYFLYSIVLQPLETLTPLLIQPGFTGKQPFRQEALAKVPTAASVLYQ